MCNKWINWIRVEIANYLCVIGECGGAKINWLKRFKITLSRFLVKI